MEPLQRTVLQMVDLKDQMIGDLVLLPPDGTGLGPIYVDDCTIGGKSVYGYKVDADGRRKLVVALPVGCDWRLLSVGLVKQMTHEQSIRAKAAIMKAAEAVEKELFPEAHEAMAAVADALKKGQIPGPTGQYL